MEKFLRWFMKLFRPDSSGFVRNIQTDPDKGEKTGGGKPIGKSKKAIHENDSFYWIPSNKIIEAQKNNQGVTTNIKISPGTGFSALGFSGEYSVRSKKQGLSKVSHRLELKLLPNDPLISEKENIHDNKLKLSILHVDKYGDGFLYGEAMGLDIKELENGHLILEGSEDNVFYEMTKACLEKALPIKE